MRLKKHLMLLTACKVSKTLINATFKAYALQYINYVKLVNNRYLEPRGKNRVYKGRSVFMRHLHDKVGEKEYMNEKEFLRTYRMNRRNFNKMVDELKDHHNFINCKKTAKENKEKLEEHLLHFLNFVGTFGDGASNDKSRFKYEKGVGTYENYRNRIIDAIIDNMKDKYYYSPNKEERKDIAHEIYQKYGFPNCLGFIDGTLFPLFFKPRRADCGDYFGRKLGYALSVLVICDHNLCIRYFNAGWPGSTYNDRIWRNSELYKNKEKYFTLIEYLLEDSAYTNKNFLLAAFTNVAGQSLSDNKTFFNDKMKPARVRAEHCIGLLKNCFQFLKSLHFVLDEKKKV